MTRLKIIGATWLTFWLTFVRHDSPQNYLCDMTHSCVWYVLFVCVTWFNMCDKCLKIICVVWLASKLFARDDSWIWPVYMCGMTQYVWHDSTCVTSATKSSVRHNSPQNYLCDMTHSCVWYVLSVCVTLLNMCDKCLKIICATWLASKLFVRHDSWIWPVYMCGMTQYVWRVPRSVWHDSFICATWLIHVCDMPCVYVRRDSTCVTSVSKSCLRHDSFIRATWLIHTCDMTHSYVRHDLFISVTWLRVGLKPAILFQSVWGGYE